MQRPPALSVAPSFAPLAAAVLRHQFVLRPLLVPALQNLSFEDVMCFFFSLFFLGLAVQGLKSSQV